MELAQSLFGEVADRLLSVAHKRGRIILSGPDGKLLINLLTDELKCEKIIIHFCEDFFIHLRLKLKEIMDCQNAIVIFDNLERSFPRKERSSIVNMEFKRVLTLCPLTVIGITEELNSVDYFVRDCFEEEFILFDSTEAQRKLYLKYLLGYECTLPKSLDYTKVLQSAKKLYLFPSKETSPCDSVDLFNGIGSIPKVQHFFNNIMAVMSEAEMAKYPKSILICGPSGIGKSVFIQSLSLQKGITCVNLKAADIIKSEVGDSEKLLAKSFANAYKSRPCFVIIDNIDYLLGSKCSSNDKLISQLSLEIDRISMIDLKIVFIAIASQLKSVPLISKYDKIFLL